MNMRIWMWSWDSKINWNMNVNLWMWNWDSKINWNMNIKFGNMNMNSIEKCVYVSNYKSGSILIVK